MILYSILSTNPNDIIPDQPGSEWSGQSVCWRSLSLPPLRAARGLLRASLWFPSDTSGNKHLVPNITDIGIYSKLCPQFLWIFNTFFIASPLTKKLPTSAWLLSWWWMVVCLSPKPDRRTLSTWTWSQLWGCCTICSPSTNISARTPLTTSSGAVWPTNQPALSLSQSAELDLTASLTSLNIQKPSWSAILCLQTASYFYFV